MPQGFASKSGELTNSPSPEGDYRGANEVESNAEEEV